MITLLLRLENSYGQANFLETESPVYYASINKSGSKIAFADAERIKIISVDSFEPIWELSYNIEEKGMVSEFIFSPTNDSLFWIRWSRFNGELFRSDINVYPDDSLYLYNLNETNPIAAFLGTSFVAHANNESKVFLGVNNFFPYHYDGKVHYAARPLGFITIPQQVQYESNRVIASLMVSNDDAFVAVVYYDRYENGIAKHSIDLRDFQTFEPLTLLDEIAGKPTLLSFSTDGRYLVYAISEGGFSSKLHAVSIPDLKTVQLSEVTDTPGLIVSGDLLFADSHSIHRMNLSTGEKKWSLWPNLTDLWSFSGFIPLNENEIIVWGSLVAEEAIFSYPRIERGGIEKVNLLNLNIYAAHQEVFGSDTLFLSEGVTVMDNLLSLTPDYAIHNKDLFFIKGSTLTSNASSLQIWDSKKRRKLHEISFTGDIKVFPDDQNKFLLIAESLGTIGSRGGYRLHILDLMTGITRFRNFSDYDYDFIDFSYLNAVSCIATQGNDGEWICTSSDNSLWKIDYLIEPESIFILPKERNREIDKEFTITNISIPPGSKNVVFTVFSSNSLITRTALGNGPDTVLSFSEPFSLIEGTYSLNLLSFESKQLSSQSWNHFMPINENIYWVRDSMGVYFADISNNKVISKVPVFEDYIHWGPVVGDEVVYMVYKPNRNHLFDSLKIVPWTIDPLLPREPLFIPKFSNAFYSSDDNFSFVAENQINTFFRQERTILPWGRTFEEANIDPSRISVDNNGLILFNYSELIDVYTLENQKVIDSFRRGSLLRGENEGNLIYIKSNLYSGESREHFQFVIAPLNGADKILWESDQIYLRSDEYSVPVNALLVSPGGKYVAAYNNSTWENGRILLIDVDAKTVIDIPSGRTANLLFSPDDEYLFVQLSNKSATFNANRDTTFRYMLYRCIDGNLVQELDAGFTAFTPYNGLVLKAGYGGVELLKMDGRKLISQKHFYSRESIGSTMFFESSGYIAGGSSSGNLFLWNEDSQSPAKVLSCGTNPVISLYEVFGKMYVFMSDGTVTIVDVAKAEITATLKIRKRDEFYSVAWFTPDGYFKASRQDAREYHLVRGMYAFPLFTYEIFLNRPDIILSRIGFADNITIDLFYSAFKRRLARHKLSDVGSFSLLSLPEIKVINKEKLPAIAQSRDVEIDIEAVAVQTPLSRLHLSVNGVPLYGTMGLEIAGTSFQKTEKIRLNSGVNRISISVADVNGLESLPEVVEMHGQFEPKQSIYFLGFGVSNYRDSTMNLRFADYDAQRLKQFFDSRFKEEEVVSEIFVNEQVTREKVLSVKDRLANTREDDIVVISFAGHGLLDENLEFYFATHDISFSNPEERGVRFEEINDLLDKIPARRKLLLMDACHSGEVDTLSGPVELTVVGESLTAWRPRGATMVAHEGDIGLKNSFLLMQTLFNDLTRGNGSFVISAAAGMEYAYETEEHGGVFTYSFMNAFYEASRLSYHNTKVRISDIQRLTNQKVLELTNGMQQPTSRGDNLEWDWHFD